MTGGRLDGRVAVLAGAASGIGRATAERFLAEGARVMIGDLNAAGGSSLVDRAGRHKISRGVPMGRYGQPEEIAAAIVFLLGPDASFITGTVSAVDGGMTAA